MSRRDEFKAFMKINKRAAPNITSEAHRGYLNLAKSDYGLTTQEAEKILKEVGIAVQTSFNYFKELKLNIDEIKSLRDTAAEERILEAYHKRVAEVRRMPPNNPRKAELQNLLAKARVFLIDEGKWKQHIKEVEESEVPTPVPVIEEPVIAETEEVADVNKKDEDGRTPLHFAADYPNYERVETLLNNGMDVNAKDDNGKTPLHLAAKRAARYRIKRGPTIDIVKLLLKNGANVNEKDNSGETPLHAAARNNAADVVEMLLKNGANVNEKNNSGETPRRVAANNVTDAAEAVLRKYGGRKGVRSIRFWLATSSIRFCIKLLGFAIFWILLAVGFGFIMGLIEVITKG